MKTKFLLLIYGISTRVIFNLVGNLMLSEIFSALLLPFNRSTKNLKYLKSIKVLVICLLTLLVSQIISDELNNSNPNDYLRGWALIIFSIISILFLSSLLLRNVNGIVYLLFGLFIVRLITGEGELDLSLWEENTNYFKIRFVVFLNPLVTLIAYLLYKNKYGNISILLLIMYSLICIIFDARANSLIFLFAAIFLAIKRNWIILNFRKILFFSFFVGIFFYGLYAYYANLVINDGFGGKNARTQFAMVENPYNPFELLFYGRTDFVIGFQAIKDSPVFGHGSWAKDKTGKYLQLAKILTGSNNIKDRGFIPSHSIIIGAWLYSGILGFFAIIFVFLVLTRNFIYLYRNTNTNYMPILVVLFVDLVWNFFFSPYGHLRTTVPIAASFILVLSEKCKSEQLDTWTRAFPELA